MPQYACLCSCSWKPNRLRNHIWGPARVLRRLCESDFQCSAWHTNLTSFFLGSSGLVLDFMRFLEGTTCSTVFGKAKFLGKQACLTRTCVGVAVNCRHMPMCGLHGVLYSGVIPLQKGCTESEITAKSIIRPRPELHVCPTSGATMLALWPRLWTHPVSHSWSGSMLKSAAIANGVRIEWVNSKICAILTWLAACASSPVEKYANTTAKVRPFKCQKNGCPIPTFQGLRKIPITFQIPWEFPVWLDHCHGSPTGSSTACKVGRCPDWAVSLHSQSPCLLSRACQVQMVLRHSHDVVVHLVTQ